MLSLKAILYFWMREELIERRSWSESSWRQRELDEQKANNSWGTDFVQCCLVFVRRHDCQIQSSVIAPHWAIRYHEGAGFWGTIVSTVNAMRRQLSSKNAHHHHHYHLPALIRQAFVRHSLAQSEQRTLATVSHRRSSFVEGLDEPPVQRSPIFWAARWRTRTAFCSAGCTPKELVGSKYDWKLKKKKSL